MPSDEKKDENEFRSKGAFEGWITPREMLPKKTLDQIDAMLAAAKDAGLEGCNDKIKISRFILEHTDFTECHLVALNYMEFRGNPLKMPSA